MKTIGRLLILALVCSSSLLMASLVNPGFETGALTGWSVAGLGDPTYVEVVTTDWTDPLSGTYFADLIAGAVDCSAMEGPLGLNGQICSLGGTFGSLIYQSVNMAAGQRIREWANFQANDSLPYNDFGFWAFSGPGVSSPVGVIASVSTVGGVDGNTSGWVPVSFTAPQSGTYIIGFGVFNVLDNEVNSQLGVDDAPEPATWLTLGLGMGILAAVRRRRMAR